MIDETNSPWDETPLTDEAGISQGMASSAFEAAAPSGVTPVLDQAGAETTSEDTGAASDTDGAGKASLETGHDSEAFTAEQRMDQLFSPLTNLPPTVVMPSVQARASQLPEGMVVLSQTVQGHSHVVQGKVCQDASYVERAEDNAWCMAVVSDGHGDPSCMRSNRGSQFAVDAATSCLREFAAALNEPDLTGHRLADDLLVPARQGVVMRRLTDAIVSRWGAAVRADVTANPFTDDELAGISDVARERYQRGERLEHAYGATLVCALWLPKVLVLLQQGDGVCLIVEGDGTIANPVPEDERCLANITTSLCDEDAADGIRHAVVALRETPVCACLLTSDGVANSFGDRGVDTYARELLADLAGDGDAARVTEGLAQSLPELSRRGSGDDMSVALLASMQAVEPLAKGFAASAERQKLADEVAMLQDKLVSMERKHVFLAQQRDNALAERARLKQQADDCESQLRKLSKDAEKVREELAELEERCNRLHDDVEELHRRHEDYNAEPHEWRMGSLAFPLPDPYERDLARLKSKEGKASMRYSATLGRHDQMMKDARELRERFAQANEDYETFDMTPVGEFEEYDAQYQELDEKLRERQAQLAALEAR